MINRLLEQQSSNVPLGVQPPLVIENLSVQLETEGGTVHAVNGLSLKVERQEVVALVGESGCGKSLTANAIMGLLPPNYSRVEGSIRVCGTEVVRLSQQGLRDLRGRRVASVFQDPQSSLNPSMRIGLQIAEPLRLHEKMSKKLALRRAVELLGEVGISDPQRRANEYPHQLSGGMRQRVLIAMAISCGPDVLVADEPTTALDVTVQAGVLELLMKLKDDLGMALLLITHDLGVVASIADRVAVMYTGTKVEEANVFPLFSMPIHPYTRGLLASVPDSRKTIDGKDHQFQGIPGIVPTVLAPLAACPFLPRCGRASSRCGQAVPDLVSTGRDSEHYYACFNPEEIA